MAEISLGLLVLRASDVEKSLAFYRALGLDFQQEQHGSGLVHYACDLNGMVIEIYPGDPGTAPERKQGGATMIGFNVPSIDDALTQLLTLGIKPTSPPKESPWGKRTTVTDPDGRAIEISKPKS